MKKRKTVMIRIKESFRNKLKREAIDKNITMSKLLDKIIIFWNKKNVK